MPAEIAVRHLSSAEVAAVQSGLANDAATAQLREELRSLFTRGPRAVLLRAAHFRSSEEAAFGRTMEVIGGWFGAASLQSPEGETIARVESRPDDPQRRGTHSEDELQPHTDLHDILALGCVRQASRGGDSFLVSGRALRDRIARDYPESLAVLEQGYFFGTNPALRSKCPVSREKVPIFLECEGETLVCWNGYFMGAAAASRGEALPRELEAALAVLRNTAADLAAASTFTLTPGDMLFWHNWTWLHGRTAFIDDPAAPRLLLRLWLRSDLIARPNLLAQRAERIDADHRLTRDLGYRQP